MRKSREKLEANCKAIETNIKEMFQTIADIRLTVSEREQAEKMLRTLQNIYFEVNGFFLSTKGD